MWSLTSTPGPCAGGSSKWGWSAIVIRQQLELERSPHTRGGAPPKTEFRPTLLLSFPHTRRDGRRATREMC